jgi:hypothetical protein
MAKRIVMLAGTENSRGIAGQIFQGNTPYPVAAERADELLDLEEDGAPVFREIGLSEVDEGTYSEEVAPDLFSTPAFTDPVNDGKEEGFQEPIVPV